MVPSFFSFDPSSAQYISEFVCCLIPHSIISQLYNTISFSSRWLISPKLSKQSYSYGMVVPMAFHCCHVFSPHVISTPPDLTPHSSYQLLSNVMYIVILFWLATFWLIVVYNIIALTYVHQHYGTHFFEHSARNDDHEPPFTWHQRHKTIANNKERSYDDKHAMGVLLVWVYYYCLTLFVSTIVVL